MVKLCPMIVSTIPYRLGKLSHPNDVIIESPLLAALGEIMNGDFFLRVYIAIKLG
jgi:hypothetical protein